MILTDPGARRAARAAQTPAAGAVAPPAAPAIDGAGRAVHR
jgi:hypothetical protein